MEPLIKRFTIINRLFIVIIGLWRARPRVSKKSGVKEDDDDVVQVLNYPRGVSGSGVAATILD